MPNLSIKNVPERVVAKLRARAAANHRSLQGELMALVCEAAGDREPGRTTSADEETQSGWKSVEQILAEHKAIRPRAVRTGPRAVDLIRDERDAR
jgi:plasmid stability protein